MKVRGMDLEKWRRTLFLYFDSPVFVRLIPNSVSTPSMPQWIGWDTHPPTYCYSIYDWRRLNIGGWSIILPFPKTRFQGISPFPAGVISTLLKNKFKIIHHELEMKWKEDGVVVLYRKVNLKAGLRIRLQKFASNIYKFL